MSTSFNIVSIEPSVGDTPAKITVDVAVPGLFAGSFYMNESGSTLPSYTLPIPEQYTLVSATTFDITGNPQYSGRYTVYTRVSSTDTKQSAVISGNTTKITVNETMWPLTQPANASTGFVTNVSTYLIRVAAESPFVIPPGTTNTLRPLTIPGKNAAAWGEQFNQNLIRVAQNFASDAVPTSPYPGQLWYSLVNGSALGGSLKIWDSVKWADVMKGTDTNDTYRVAVSAASTSWTITHNLALSAPFVAMVSIFVETSTGVYSQIMPNSIMYTSANTLTIGFTTAQKGYVLIRR